MKPFTSVIAIMGGAVLSGCSLFQWAMPGVTLSDANVLAMLDTINMGEIESAKLAQQKGVLREGPNVCSPDAERTQDNDAGHTSTRATDTREARKPGLGIHNRKDTPEHHGKTANAVWPRVRSSLPEISDHDA